MREGRGFSVGRTTAAMLAVSSLACVAACGRGDDLACDSTAAQEALFATLRADYPNKASQEMFARGSSPALDRILREQGLDRDKPADVQKAAAAGIAEAKTIYQTGHYILENVATMESGARGPLSCSGRVVFLTSWGIIVKIVGYDLRKQEESIEAKVTTMR